MIDEGEGVISERKKLMYNGVLNVSILINDLKPFFHFEINTVGVSTTIDFKNEILNHLENEVSLLFENNAKNLKKFENYFLETEVRRILNKFLKSELGKKPQISISIHRMDLL